MKLFSFCKLILSVMTILTVFSVIPADAQEETEQDALVLSDREFEKQLFGNSGVSVPVFLGCNRLLVKEVELPVTCVHGNITAVVKHVPTTTLNVFALVERLPTVSWWESSLQVQDISLVSWAVEPRFFWHSRKFDRSTLCVIGKPSRAEDNDHYGAECLITAPGAYDPAEGTILRVTFHDRGVFELFGENSRRDDLELKVFVTFFAMNVVTL